MMGAQGVEWGFEATLSEWEVGRELVEETTRRGVEVKREELAKGSHVDAGKETGVDVAVEREGWRRRRRVKGEAVEGEEERMEVEGRRSWDATKLADARAVDRCSRGDGSEASSTKEKINVS